MGLALRTGVQARLVEEEDLLDGVPVGADFLEGAATELGRLEVVLGHVADAAGEAEAAGGDAVGVGGVAGGGGRPAGVGARGARRGCGAGGGEGGAARSLVVALLQQLSRHCLRQVDEQ